MNTPSRRDMLLPPVPPALAETPVRCDQVLPSPPRRGPWRAGVTGLPRARHRL